MVINKEHAMFYAQTLWYRLKVSGVVGLTLIAVAIGVYFLILIPQTNDLQSKQNELRAILQDKAAVESKENDTPFITNDLDLGGFLKTLPASGQKDSAIKKVVEFAEKNGIPLDSGKYETTFKETYGLLTLQMSFPITSTYPQLKHFLADIFNLQPNAAIVQLSMKRASTQTNSINAEVTLRLYFGQEP